MSYFTPLCIDCNMETTIHIKGSRCYPSMIFIILRCTLSPSKQSPGIRPMQGDVGQHRRKQFRDVRHILYVQPSDTDTIPMSAPYSTRSASWKCTIWKYLASWPSSWERSRGCGPSISVEDILVPSYNQYPGDLRTLMRNVIDGAAEKGSHQQVPAPDLHTG